MDVLNSILNNFGINKSIFVMAALFVATYLFVSQVALKKLSSFLVERDVRLDGRFKKAAALRAELQEISDKLSAEKKQAQKEASENFSTIRNKAQEEQRKILLEAKQKAASQIAATRESVQVSLNAEMKKVEADMPVISRLIIDQLLSGKSTKHVDKELTQSEV